MTKKAKTIKTQAAQSTLLTITRAAAIRGVDRSTIWRRIKDGTIPAIKLNGATSAYLISSADLPAELAPRKPGRKPRQHTGSGDLAATEQADEAATKAER